MSMLESLPIFKGLNETTLAKVDAVLETRTCGDNVVLFSQGDPSDAFYIIQSGSVRVLRQTGGVDRELAVLSEGDFFGEMGVIDNAERSAACVTQGETTLLVIEKDNFLRMMATNPTISRQVMSAVVKRTQGGLAGLSAEEGPKKGVIVGLFSASGGVGTTFIAANVAGALKELTGKRVLVVDLDLMFGDQGVMFDVKPERSMEDFIGDDEVDEEKLLKTVMSTKSGVSLLQAPNHPETAEALEGGMVITILEMLRNHFDYIICDTAHVVQEFNIHVLELVQIPIYVLTPDFFGLKNCTRWYNLMEKIRFPVSRIEFLFNKHEDEADDHSLEWLEERFGKEPVSVIPFDMTAAKDSIDHGELVVIDSPDSELAKGIEKVACEIAGIEVEEDSEDSWWSKWIPL